jgi:hypothetical protein
MPRFYCAHLPYINHVSHVICLRVLRAAEGAANSACRYGPTHRLRNTTISQGNSYCSQANSLRQYTTVCRLMMVVWPQHVVVITSEEGKENCCVDGPIIAWLRNCSFEHHVTFLLLTRRRGPSCWQYTAFVLTENPSLRWQMVHLGRLLRKHVFACCVHWLQFRY